MLPCKSSHAQGITKKMVVFGAVWRCNEKNTSATDHIHTRYIFMNFLFLLKMDTEVFKVHKNKTSTHERAKKRVHVPLLADLSLKAQSTRKAVVTLRPSHDKCCRPATPGCSWWC